VGTALDGIFVVDFSRVLAGPLVAMTLGDLGADVVKVEAPGGDDTRRWLPPTDAQERLITTIITNFTNAAADIDDIITKKMPALRASLNRPP